MNPQIQLPRYYLPRPPLDLDTATIAAFDSLWAQMTSGAHGHELPYSLPVPRWQFLCYLTDHKPVVLHGSGNPDVAVFEPRQAADIMTFGNRAAVYAAADGIWPIYFAILDRDRYAMSLTNSCIRIATPTGETSDRFYFCWIFEGAVSHEQWETGAGYTLPGPPLDPQPPIPSGGATIHVLQCASPLPVTPIAKLRVTPDDFPFLDQIRGHDDQLQMQRARANPDAFPWVDDD